MNATPLARGGAAVLSYGTDWLYLLVPLLGFVAGTVYLVATGRDDEGNRSNRMLDRYGRSLERITGLPAWSASGLLLGLFALLVAALGFYWDVGWHIALGRDELLFTPAHMMILIGLMLILVSGITSITFATRTRASVGLRVGPWVVPYGAMCLVLLGAGALMGFPLDEFWHRAYGIDVTMWGPTHLLMISGASFTPFALWLLLTETGPQPNPVGLTRAMKLRLAGGLMLGLSTFQGEFDFGVPQFQQLYHPVLIGLAASVGLVAARAALGPWGALKAVAFFLAARTVLALLVGQALNLVVPRFPLYLGAALAVEAAAVVGRRMKPVYSALFAGALVGTAGLAVEWGWMQVWGRHPWEASLFPGALTAIAIAIPGAVIGLATGRVLSFRRAGAAPAVLGVSALAIVGLLAVPFPRRDADISGTLSTTRTGPGRVAVEIAVDPADAADGTDWFEVLSWQGGAMHSTPLQETGPGRYEAARPVPVGGDWKSLVRLARKDALVALPVYMPEDPLIGAHEIPVAPRRRDQFVADSRLLMRESRSGPVWPAVVAYSAILAVVITWLAALAYSYAAMGNRHVRRNGQSPSPAPPAPTTGLRARHASR